MIKTIIVEDEKRNIQVLKKMLAEFCPEVELIDVYETVKDAVKGIPTQLPELIFMDVILSDGSAFDILKQLPERNFEVVFITAYNEYAIDAIKFSALDYLLKPLNIDELQLAVDKAMKKAVKNLDNNHFDALMQNINSSSGKLQRLAMPGLQGYLFIDLGDIIRFEADGNYASVHLVSKEKVFVSKSLKEFEDILNNHGFFRVHNSHLINLAHIKQYFKGNGGYVLMDDDSSVDVAARRKEEFLKAMNIH